MHPYSLRHATRISACSTCPSVAPGIVVLLVAQHTGKGVSRGVFEQITADDEPARVLRRFSTCVGLFLPQQLAQIAARTGKIAGRQPRLGNLFKRPMVEFRRQVRWLAVHALRQRIPLTARDVKFDPAALRQHPFLRLRLRLFLVQPLERKIECAAANQCVDGISVGGESSRGI